MIERYYPAPAPYKKFWPGIALTHTPKDPLDPVGYKESKEAERAEKRGLSTAEYRARVALVSAAQTGCPYQVGDTVWPRLAKDAKRYGKCMITAFCRHFDDYGEVEWNDPPFLLSVSPLKDRTQSVQCSVGWVTRTEPTITEVTTDEC